MGGVVVAGTAVQGYEVSRARLRISWRQASHWFACVFSAIISRSFLLLTASEGATPVSCHAYSPNASSFTTHDFLCIIFSFVDNAFYT